MEFQHSTKHFDLSRSSFTTDGEHLVFFKSGKRSDEGPTRLFIQGLGCEADVIWSPVWKQLEELGDTNLRLSLNSRGIGGSTGWPDSLEQMADDAAAFIDRQANKPVEVIGHSLGGIVAMYIAARHPSLVSSLVLMDTVPKYSDKTRSGFQWRSEEIQKAQTVTTIFDIVIPRSFSKNTQITNASMVTNFQAMLARQSSDVYAHICLLAAQANAKQAFDSLTLPILFASGEEDVSTSPDIMRRLIRNPTDSFVEIPKAGHNPPLEQPRYVAQMLLKNSKTDRAS